MFSELWLLVLVHLCMYALCIIKAQNSVFSINGIIEIFVTNGEINRPCLLLVVSQFNILFIIRTTLLTWFKTEKSCKWCVNHHLTIGVSVYAGSQYMISCVVRGDVISKSRGCFILLGANTSHRRIIIHSLKINPFSGISLVSELFYQSTYII